MDTTAIANITPYALAREAGCACPDTPESPGARFLDSVRNGIIELLDSIEDLNVDTVDDDGSVAQIVDDAANIYTATLWAEFVDLGAYNEDPTDLGFAGSDMEQGARICLYIIAERLAHRLIQIVAHPQPTD